MNRIAHAMVLSLAVFLVLLGGVFIIASGAENILVGSIFIGTAALLFYLTYRSDKINAARPRLVNQTFNVRMDVSGDLEQKQLTCRSCGAPLTDNNLQVVRGGIIVKCPYCSSTHALEEMPKW
ncbi:MAG: hypothetical protein GX307_03810 [Euryarchaeota archaeon]|nr:hypothetical protein [Euryarchaeota archaeon]